MHPPWLAETAPAVGGRRRAGRKWTRKGRHAAAHRRRRDRRPARRLGHRPAGRARGRVAGLRGRPRQHEVLAARADRPRQRGRAPRGLAVGVARQPHRHREPHDAAGAAGRLQVDAGARRRRPLRQDVAVAGGGRRRRDGRDPLGVRPRKLGGRAARQHRLQRAGGGLLVGRAGRARLPAHRQRLPVGARRADGAARRRLRRGRGRRRHPGPAPADPAARLPADVGAHRRR